MAWTHVCAQTSRSVLCSDQSVSYQLPVQVVIVVCIWSDFFFNRRCYSQDWQEQTGVGQTSGGAREGDNCEGPDSLTLLQPTWSTVPAEPHWYTSKRPAFPLDNVATVGRHIVLLQCFFLVPANVARFIEVWSISAFAESTPTISRIVG